MIFKMSAESPESEGNTREIFHESLTLRSNNFVKLKASLQTRIQPTVSVPGPALAKLKAKTPPWTPRRGKRRQEHPVDSSTGDTIPALSQPAD